MKRIASISLLSLMVLLAASARTTFAQTATPPKATTAKPATAKSGAATKPAVGTRAGVATASGPKLPPGVPVVRGLVKPAFTLKYQDFKIGTGALAEPNKIYKVLYTGWLASDGTMFDSSDSHRTPVLDKDGKPQNDADGKPMLNKPEPLAFPQGFGRLIPGWDQGFEGMKVGGKRRLFIPYQLAYGSAGRPPKIPAKSDLIFDVELVEISDLPQRPGGPGVPGGMGGPGGPGGRQIPIRPMTPGAPGVPASPAAPKPVAPANPAPGAAPAPTVPTPPAPTAPAAAPPTATPDKPANPAQPN
jgi:peptidylprolyl isomerase